MQIYQILLLYRSVIWCLRTSINLAANFSTLVLKFTHIFWMLPVLFSENINFLRKMCFYDLSQSLPEHRRIGQSSGRFPAYFHEGFSCTPPEYECFAGTRTSPQFCPLAVLQNHIGEGVAVFKFRRFFSWMFCSFWSTQVHRRILPQGTSSQMETDRHGSMHRQTPHLSCKDPRFLTEILNLKFPEPILEPQGNKQ